MRESIVSLVCTATTIQTAQGREKRGMKAETEGVETDHGGKEGGREKWGVRNYSTIQREEGEEEGKSFSSTELGGTGAGLG